ncbi:MAG: isopentenyl-diphosphate Delta-isomerase [Bacteroidia bacterium]|nr:isopentenyl-diphosphate Delta-isomerase [Bacteroidia bacterium]NNL32882.1 isopentenyl-diphosphate Delta-isomerase [Flavobacteriaceae bacterium]RZW48327.1 MAG: isopentenyl-diphosphate Delta-isomerase [Flavobacteriaceae bacterium]
MEEYVILVDDNDVKIGIMPKMLAHEKALLHRAFSVFIFNDKNELMLQQRALDKYHSPGLWTNTCCSHQRENESNVEAGKRRLQEEMGFETELKETTSFIYKAAFDNGLTEHEYDHVMVGHYNGIPKINPDEVAEWKWMDLEEVKVDIELKPDLYTAWFKIIFEKFYKYLNTSIHESDHK